MLNLFQISVVDFLFFTLIFFRLSSLIVTMPFFGGEQVPIPIRITLVLAIGFVIFSTVDKSLIQVPTSVYDYVLFIVRELFIGIAIGFLASIPFYAVQLGGEIIAIQMGLTQIEAIDPLSQTNLPSIGQLILLFIMTIFLVTDGHHQLLTMLIDSIYMIPIGSIRYSQEILDYAVQAFNSVILIGMRIAVPVMVIDLILLSALAFVARLVPQMNLFILSFPIKIGAGTVILFLTVPLILALFYELFAESTSGIYGFLEYLTGNANGQ